MDEKPMVLQRLLGPLALVLKFDIFARFDEAFHLRHIALVGRAVQGGQTCDRSCGQISGWIV